MLQAGHRRNNSGDGSRRRPASDEEEVRGMRSPAVALGISINARRRLRPAAPASEAAAETIADLRAVVVATLVGACAVAAVAQRRG